MTDNIPRIAAFRAAGSARYGLSTADGLIDLTPEFGTRFAGLKQVIAAGALEEVIAAGSTREPVWSEGDVEFLPPLAAPEKIICVGVNYPDRNAEYRDGQAAPTNPSLFVRFPGSLVGHGANPRPPRRNPNSSTTRARSRSSSARPAAASPGTTPTTTSPR